MTTKEILDELGRMGVVVVPVGRDLVSRGRPGHERSPRINALLKSLAEKHRRNPRVVEQQIHSARRGSSPDRRTRLVN